MRNTFVVESLWMAWVLTANNTSKNVEQTVRNNSTTARYTQAVHTLLTDLYTSISVIFSSVISSLYTQSPVLINKTELS
jgi:hypothetical protein